jgi:hypothetical protein
MAIDPLTPVSIEDVANYLADTFYPPGGFDIDKLISIGQWITRRNLTVEEGNFMLQALHDRIVINKAPTRVLPEAQ